MNAVRKRRTVTYGNLTTPSLGRLIAAAAVVFLLAACVTHSTVSATQKPAAATLPVASATSERLDVTAVVDKIERNAYQDFMTDGTVLLSTVVTLTIVQPETYWGQSVAAHCSGRPFLEQTPLLVGQRVTFTLPAPAARSGIDLQSLANLRRPR